MRVGNSSVHALSSLMAAKLDLGQPSSLDTFDAVLQDVHALTATGMTAGEAATVYATDAMGEASSMGAVHHSTYDRLPARPRGTASATLMLCANRCPWLARMCACQCRTTLWCLRPTRRVR